MASHNKRTKITASVIGVLLGMAGIINHGVFEILQGKRSTNGFFIDAIGEANRYWIHGTEAAFTIIPNYLLTGISVILVGLAVVFWSLNYACKTWGNCSFITFNIIDACRWWNRTYHSFCADLGFYNSSKQIIGLVEKGTIF